MKAVEFSRLGHRLSEGSGIIELMDDLGRVMAGNESLLMMGGGAPARIPAVEAVWRRRVEEMLTEGDTWERVVGTYDGPQGNPRFQEAVASFLQREFGWRVEPENVAVTAGGQCAFFYLFNLLAGEMPDGGRRRILFPLVPEYIGYESLGLSEGILAARKPVIEPPVDHRFKYRVDFENLVVGEDVAAICVSRPTNPSGNVLTNGEIGKLRTLARRRGIPLIIDNAYGHPFPGVIFEEARLEWDEDVILTMSLSKLGLPGTRTGIVIARKEITRALASMTAVAGLANNNVGQAIVAPMLENDEILRVSRELIEPFYRAKSEHGLECVRRSFPDDLPYAVHQSEGAFFLWIWFQDLPITSMELYRRLKERRLLVIPGEYFFYGIDEPGWRHQHECVRVTFAQSEATVEEGTRILAEEVQRAYREG